MPSKQRRTCCICHEIRPKTITMPKNSIEAQKWFIVVGEKMPLDYAERVYYICDLHFPPGALDNHEKGNRRSNGLMPLPIRRINGVGQEWIGRMMERGDRGEDPTSPSSYHQQFQLNLRRYHQLSALSQIQLNSRPSMRTSFSELINRSMEAALRSDFYKFYGNAGQFAETRNFDEKTQLDKEAGQGNDEKVFLEGNRNFNSDNSVKFDSVNSGNRNFKVPPRILAAKTGALTLPRIVIKRPLKIIKSEEVKKMRMNEDSERGNDFEANPFSTTNQEDQMPSTSTSHNQSQLIRNQSLRSLAINPLLQQRIQQKLKTVALVQQEQLKEIKGNMEKLRNEPRIKTEPKTLRDIVTNPQYYHYTISTENQRKSLRDSISMNLKEGRIARGELFGDDEEE